MKAKIKTEVLKDLVAKAVKGVGNNKLIPITTLMELCTFHGQLHINTTDMVHFLYVRGDLVSGDIETIAPRVVIEAEKFAKLVSKITTEFVEIEDKEKYLEITGNGKYTLDIPLDENGERIKFPSPEYTTLGETLELKKSVVDLISSVCKASVAKTLEVPVYTNYYVGDSVLSTDTYAISSVNLNLFNGRKMLIPAELMDLFAVFDEETIKVDFTSSNFVKFSTKNVTIIGRLAEGTDEYAVDAISGLVQQRFDSECEFKTAEMISALERIALFVGPYDDSAVKLTFTENGISIESKQSNGVEVIPYTVSENYVPFTCMININMLLAQLKARGTDRTIMQYGEENSVKLIDGAVTQVIALLEK